MSKKIHMSMRGVPVDMEALMSKHENDIALGNAQMNARGDIIGEGGQVITRREELARAHQLKKQANANVSLKPANPDKFETPAEALARIAKMANNKSQAAPVVPDEFDYTPEELKEMESFDNPEDFDDSDVENKNNKKKRTLVEKD